MRKRIEISDNLKIEIFNKFDSGMSMRQIEDQYDFSFTYIQKLINSRDHEEKLKNSYSQRDGYKILAKCKKTNKVIEDYSNKSGGILKHLKQVYPNIKIESNYKRKSIEYDTGKFWYDDYFDFIYEKELKRKKCYYCDWSTEDINNLSGSYEKHLNIAHNKDLNQYINDNPTDKSYFKKEIYKNLVECKICGKKLKMINSKHLEKHGISVYDYKMNYDLDMVSNTTQIKLRNNYENALKNLPFTQSSSLEKKIIDNLPEIDFEISNRTILNGKEIDLFAKNLNVAIEVNGCIYHTENFGKKDKFYHLDKTNKCENKKINLIHIFEDELNNPLVTHKLKHILNISDSKKIYGRKTKVVAIEEATIKNEFLDKHHIQGFDRSNISLGLYYSNQLVAVMCFDNKRVMNKTKSHDVNTYELTRYATHSNYRVIGGASKLLKHFIKLYNPFKIISFADRRWTPNRNNLYEKLGFKLTKILPPDYTYYNSSISRYKRFHKFGFGKSSLKKKYPEIYNDNKTEWMIMQEAGWDRIWDCGK